MNTSAIEKDNIAGRIVKLLKHKRLDRGMILMEEQSRCVQKNQVHELVTTDQQNLSANSRIDRVGFLGFVEINNNGVIERGDNFYIGSCFIGTVAGFDSCHAPNHYNIIIEVPKLITATDISLQVGQYATFSANQVISNNNHLTSFIRPIIIGFGFCGSQLHLPCIKKALAYFENKESDATFIMPPISVIEPSCSPYLNQQSIKAIQAYKTIKDIPQDNFENTVIHLCSPPRDRLAALQEAVKLGARRFIIEKPMAVDNSQLEEMKKIITTFNLDVLVVANWSSSLLTDKLINHINKLAVKGISIRALRIVQNKSRIEKSLESCTHQSALEVEIPHMLVLAILLGGAKVEIISASVWDLNVDGQKKQDLGGASLTLQFASGCIAELYSDLVSPTKERSVEIEFTDGSKVKGYYPSDSYSLYSFLYEYNTEGEIIKKWYMHDDTLKQFLIQAYQYFFFAGKKPRSDFYFHLTVCSLILQAKLMASKKQNAINEEVIDEYANISR
jgi:hypothetical protein